MTNFTKKSENFMTREGLYRIWVPMRDDGKAPLISIWIDPTMAAFERQQRHEDSSPSGVSDSSIAEEIEDSLRRIVVAPGSRRQSLRTLDESSAECPCPPQETGTLHLI
jgi:hypothetical protein